MAEKGSGGRGCLKFGCFGCAALVVVPIVLVAILLGINLLTRQPSEPVEESYVRPVAREGRSAEEPPRDPVPGGELSAPEVGSEGEVVVDIAFAEFTVVPGRAGEPIRLEADYDRSRFEVVERFDERPDGTWTYRLKFGFEGSPLFNLFGRSNNRLRLVLPPDVPIRLRCDVRMGAGEIDLGGLWVREAHLSLRMGGADLDVSEPLVEPMERLTVSGRMGGARIRRLGNASPREATFEQRMGGVELDLDGAWRNDADLRVSAAMGGLTVRGTDTVNVVVGERSLTMGEIEVRDRREPDPSLPTVTVHASGTMGGVQVY